MTAPAVGSGRDVPRVVPRVLLALLGVSAACTATFMVWGSGYGSGRPLDGEAVSSVLLMLWVVLPFAAMGAVVVAASRRSRAATAVVALGVVALVAFTVFGLVGLARDESSTAGLVFLFLPLYELLGVLATAVVAVVAGVVVSALRRRRVHRELPAGLRD